MALCVAARWPAGVALVGLVVTALVWSPLLRVSRVDVTGLRRVEASELRHLAGVPNGAFLGAVSEAEVAGRLRAHPWVAEVAVERRWPSTLAVRIVEHAPVALVRRDGTLWYVDASGLPFLRARIDDADYPVISGIPEDLAASDPRAGRLVIRDALALLAALSASPLGVDVEVSEVVFSVSRGFELRLVGAVDGRPGARVVLGYVRPGDAAARVGRLAELVAGGVRLTSPLLVDVGGDRVALVRPDLPQTTVPMAGALSPNGMVLPPAGALLPAGSAPALPVLLPAGSAPTLPAADAPQTPPRAPSVVGPIIGPSSAG